MLGVSSIHLQPPQSLKTTTQCFVKQSPQPAFNRKFDRLIAYLNENHEKGYQNIICCASAQQAQRLNSIFEESDSTVHYKTEVKPLFEGFEDIEGKLAVFTDHQIFERYHKFQLKSSYTKKQALTLKELTHLEIGDYVTHIDHGIGRFAGLQKIDVDGSQQEAIKLVYAARDILFLSIHSLHKSPNTTARTEPLPKFINWDLQLGRR